MPTDIENIVQTRNFCIQNQIVDICFSGSGGSPWLWWKSVTLVEDYTGSNPVNGVGTTGSMCSCTKEIPKRDKKYGKTRMGISRKWDM